MVCVPTRRALLTSLGVPAIGAALAWAFVLGLGVNATPSAHAQTYTESTLHIFTDAPDGATPWAGLIGDTAGNLYGTTADGGDTYGQGTVFKLDTTGKETVLYSFLGYPDAATPEASLVRDPAGNLFGTSSDGGAGVEGTVFELDATGKETVLYSFMWTDGRYPDAGLVRDAAGNLYGTTDNGGAYRYGTVFKVTKRGTKTVLYSFRGGVHGAFPFTAGLALDSAGNLYGTTYYGGNSTCTKNGVSGCGTVFRVTKAGKGTVLYSFLGGTDGAYPDAGLVRDAAGNLYGTTSGGGTGCYGYGCGTVFKLSTSGKEIVLYAFTGGTDGAYPVGPLVRDAKGNLYGASGGGTYGQVFKVTGNGKETVLYNFTGGTDGAYPVGPLVRDKTGNLYGIASAGGVPGCGVNSNGCGTVFKLVP